MCLGLSNVYANDEYLGVVGSSFDAEGRYFVDCSSTNKARGNNIFWKDRGTRGYTYYTNGTVFYWFGTPELNHQGVNKKDFFDVYVGSPYCYGLPSQG